MKLRRRNFRFLKRRLNNSPSQGLNWKQTEPQEGCKMIKGVTRRVIVVKSPDTRYFEEAIFVVKDDVFRERGADSAEILKEAQRIANSYAPSVKGRAVKRTLNIPAPFFAAAGAAAAGAALLASGLCGL